MKLMLLAAGLGTRLRPVTDKIPKPAVPLLTVPMIFYPFYHFNNLNQVVVNTFHLPDVLKNTLQKQSRNFSAQIISDGNQVLGTGGGIKNAENYLKGDDNFFVANSDSVFLPSKQDFMEQAKELHIKNKALATLVVIEDARVKTKNWGAVWVDKKDNILTVGKNKPSDSNHGYHYVGFLVLNEKIFDFLPSGVSNIFDDGIMPALRAGEKVQIFKTSGAWFETGNPDEYLESTQLLLQAYLDGNNYLHSLLKNFSPHHKFFSGSTNLPINASELHHLLIQDAVGWGGGNKFEGFVVLGNNITLGSGCHIKNSVILDNVIIDKNSKISNQIIFE